MSTNSAFEDGFDETPTDTDPPADTTTTEEGTDTTHQATTETAEQEQQPEPKFVQVTEDDFNRFRAASEKLAELEGTFTKRFDTAFGKMGGLERKLQELHAAGAITDEDIAPFQDDLPEIANVLRKLRAPAQASDEDLSARFKPVLESAVNPLIQELRETQKAAVLLVHPDMETFKESEDFGRWVATKDEKYREQLGSTWSPAFIAGALTEAKKWAEANKPKPQARQGAERSSVIEAAIQPRGTGASRPTRAAQDAFLAGFEEG